MDLRIYDSHIIWYNSKRDLPWSMKDLIKELHYPFLNLSLSVILLPPHTLLMVNCGEPSHFRDITLISFCKQLLSGWLLSFIYKINNLS